jgi:hypothetical protein
MWKIQLLYRQGEILTYILLLEYQPKLIGVIKEELVRYWRVSSSMVVVGNVVVSAMLMNWGQINGIPAGSYEVG